MQAALAATDPTADEIADLASKAMGDGCKRSFEALYRHHIGRIYGLVWRLCGCDRDLADDLTQDAFVRAWQKRSSFRGDAAFGTWMHRVAVNVVMSDGRSKVRAARTISHNVTEADLDGFGADPSDFREQGMDLDAAIAKLPERTRTVLVLYAVYGYQHDEIADMTGMALGTSKSQLHRARQLVKTHTGLSDD